MVAGSLEWYKNLWDTCHISIDKTSIVQMIHAKRMAIIGRDQYSAVEKLTGVPWYVVAALHMRECNFDFRCVLHNGEQIIGTGRKTRDVPAGRGPFDNWRDGAVDALQCDGFDKVTDWTLENTLKVCEAYNGLGYLKYHSDINTPYLWSCTDAYTSGLYSSDGHFRDDLIDKNCGVAALFKCLETGQVRFTRAAI